MPTSARRLMHFLVVIVTTALLWLVQLVWLDKGFSCKRALCTLIAAFFVADLSVKICFKREGFYFSEEIDRLVKRRLLGWYRKARKLPLWTYILLGIIWRMVTILVLAIPIVALDIQDEPPDFAQLIGNGSIGTVAVVELLAAPLVESLLFQLLPVELSDLVSRKSRYEKSLCHSYFCPRFRFGSYIHPNICSYGVFHRTLLGIHVCTVHKGYWKATIRLPCHGRYAHVTQSNRVRGPAIEKCLLKNLP